VPTALAGLEAGELVHRLLFRIVIEVAGDEQRAELLQLEKQNRMAGGVDRQSLKILGKFGKAGTAPGEFNVLHEIAADSKGNLYTAETRSRRVQRFLAKS
jgi:hypothetical protein